ncbi:MAG: DNA-3-methyladenine glycosylase [Chthonomonadales bacterium]
MGFDVSQLNLPLPVEFYHQPTLDVARQLLGTYLCKQTENGLMAGRIVEVEAYCQGDPASHSYRGPTKRNRAMYLAGGSCYVYLIYGMYWCFNVVTQSAGVGEAVLIRAVEPVVGFDGFLESDMKDLCRGPGKLCRAFGIDESIDGSSVISRDIWISNQVHNANPDISISPRIGISKGLEHHWRFYIKDSPYVSQIKKGRATV